MFSRAPRMTKRQHSTLVCPQMSTLVELLESFMAQSSRSPGS